MAVWDDVIPPEEQAEYERAGWGGRVGFGERPALVIVDMYRAFVDPDYPFSSAAAPETATAIRRCSRRSATAASLCSTRAVARSRPPPPAAAGR